MTTAEKITAIKNLFESGEIKNVFGNLFPKKENGIVTFNTFYDPINREEKYEDHDKCRTFYREILGGSAYKLNYLSKFFLRQNIPIISATTIKTATA